MTVMSTAAGEVRSCLVGIGHEEDILYLVLASLRHPDPSVARIANRDCNQKSKALCIWRRGALARGWRGLSVLNPILHSSLILQFPLEKICASPAQL